MNGTTNTIKEAIGQLKSKIIENFGPSAEMYLFGSAARGDYTGFSDVDVLVLLPGEMNISREEQVFDLAFDVGLQYDIVFGVIVYSIEFWETPRAKVMPLYKNIIQEGITI